MTEPAEAPTTKANLARAPEAHVGSMFEMPFPDDSFDLLTCLSVIEHVDTRFPDRAYVPYEEEKELAARTIDEMVRVTKPGGHINLTSECCDFDKATTDAWRPYYYYEDGPPISAAWRVGDVPSLFYEGLVRRGCELVGPVTFSPDDLDGDTTVETFRGKYFSSFAVLARKGKAS